MLKISINAPPVKPGEFQGERIAKNDVSLHELSWTPHFRRLLHNRECGHPFDLDGFEFQSIEHAFQDYKFRVVYPEEPGVFSTTGRFGKSPLDTITAMMSPSRFKMTREQFNYWNSIKVDVQYNASIAQLNTWPFKLAVLKNTGRAHLHGVLLGKETTRDFRMFWLEAIRDNIDLDYFIEHFSAQRAGADLFVSSDLSYSQVVTLSTPKDIAPMTLQSDEELARSLQEAENANLSAPKSDKPAKPDVQDTPAKPDVQDTPAKPDVQDTPATHVLVCAVCCAKVPAEEPLEEKDGML